MRKIGPAIVLALSLVFTASSYAQQTAPQFEVFGGATWLHAETNPDLTVVGLGHVSAIGWNGSATENVNRWFGATLDFSGSYARPTILIGKTSFTNEFNASVHTYMFGPSFAYRRFGRVTPFVRGLLGAVTGAASTTSKGALALGVPISISQTHFGVDAGAGVDVALSRRIALRGTGDWILSTFPDFSADRQNNFRASAGIVFRFGSRP